MRPARAIIGLAVAAGIAHFGSDYVVSESKKPEATMERIEVTSSISNVVKTSSITGAVKTDDGNCYVVESGEEYGRAYIVNCKEYGL
jgi:hypothetical protein